VFTSLKIYCLNRNILLPTKKKKSQRVHFCLTNGEYYTSVIHQRHYYKETNLGEAEKLRVENNKRSDKRARLLLKFDLPEVPPGWKY
jgi:diphthamide synthase (EF-2-diphthine--ammonia ligase)